MYVCVCVCNRPPGIPRPLPTVLDIRVGASRPGGREASYCMHNVNRVSIQCAVHQETLYPRQKATGNPQHSRLRSAKCELRTANCGLRTADCGLRTADWDPPARTQQPAQPPQQSGLSPQSPQSSQSVPCIDPAAERPSSSPNNRSAESEQSNNVGRRRPRPSPPGHSRRRRRRRRPRRRRHPTPKLAT